MPSASGLRAGKAIIELAMQGDAKIKAALTSLQARTATIGKAFTRIGTIGTAAATALGSAFLVPINAASNLEEQMNKFNVVFGDNSKIVKQWGDEFAAEVGRSKRQIVEFLAASKDLFTPLGFDESSATEMSKTVTRLAIDLASFNNMSDADTQRDLQAALTGSGEVMKKYGVIVSEAAVKQELLNQSIDPKLATNQQKVMARLNIIMAGTTAAQGDAIRSAGSFANQMKALKGRLEDTAATIGTAILPLVTKLVTKASDLAKAFASWSERNQSVFQTLAKLTIGVGTASAAMVAFGTVLRALSVSLHAVRTAAIGARFAVALLAKNPYIAAITLAIGAATTATAALSSAFTSHLPPTAKLSAKTEALEAVYAKLGKTMNEVADIAGPRTPFQISDEIRNVEKAIATQRGILQNQIGGVFGFDAKTTESTIAKLEQRLATLRTELAAEEERIRNPPKAATPEGDAAKKTSTAVAEGFLAGLRDVSSMVAKGVGAGSERLAAAMEAAQQERSNLIAAMQERQDKAMQSVDRQVASRNVSAFNTRNARQMFGGSSGLEQEQLAEQRRIRKAVENPKPQAIPVW